MVPPPPPNPHQALIRVCSLAGQERLLACAPPPLPGPYQNTCPQYGEDAFLGRTLCKGGKAPCPHIMKDKGLLPNPGLVIGGGSVEIALSKSVSLTLKQGGQIPTEFLMNTFRLPILHTANRDIAYPLHKEYMYCGWLHVNAPNADPCSKQCT